MSFPAQSPRVETQRMESANVDRGLKLRLPAEPGSVSVLRQAVVDEAEKLGMDPPRITDLKTAVSEACANAVLHAYADADQPGPIEVELAPISDGVLAVVRDFGGGLRPSAAPRDSGLGVGLSLIGALSDFFQLTSILGRGTEIRIQIPLSAEGTR
jgi:anti-sigma regulatory factor (Ser/Thr protein kinase)